MGEDPRSLFSPKVIISGGRYGGGATSRAANRQGEGRGSKRGNRRRVMRGGRGGGGPSGGAETKTHAGPSPIKIEEVSPQRIDFSGGRASLDRFASPSSPADGSVGGDAADSGVSKRISSLSPQARASCLECRAAGVEVSSVVSCPAIVDVL